MRWHSWVQVEGTTRISTQIPVSLSTVTTGQWVSIICRRPQLHVGCGNRAESHLRDAHRWGECGGELLRGLLQLELRGQGERHHRWLPPLCRHCHGGLRGGGDPWKRRAQQVKMVWSSRSCSLQQRRRAANIVEEALAENQTAGQNKSLPQLKEEGAGYAPALTWATFKIKDRKRRKAESWTWVNSSFFQKAKQKKKKLHIFVTNGHYNVYKITLASIQ